MRTKQEEDAPAGAGDAPQPDAGRGANGYGYEGLSPFEAGRAAARAVAELSGKELHGVVSVEATEEEWLVSVEVVEDRRIPSTNDMLAVYTVRLDPDGELLSYRRSSRYIRGRPDGKLGGEHG